MSTEKLKEYFVSMRSQGLSGGSAFFDELQSHPNDYAVTQFCLWLLASMSESNSVLEAIRASLEIAYRQQTYVLPRLEAIYESLPKRKGGFRDYRQDVEHAIDVLKRAKSGKLCRCEVISVFEHAPEAHDFIHIVDIDNGEYEKVMDCRCTICNRYWQVTYTDQYHYPMFRWAQNQE